MHLRPEVRGVIAPEGSLEPPVAPQQEVATSAQAVGERGKEPGESITQTAVIVRPLLVIHKDGVFVGGTLQQLYKGVDEGVLGARAQEAGFEAVSHSHFRVR